MSGAYDDINTTLNLYLKTLTDDEFRPSLKTVPGWLLESGHNPALGFLLIFHFPDIVVLGGLYTFL